MELNKKYLDQQGLAELIQTIAQISYNLSDTDATLSTHITNVTDLLFGPNYEGDFPEVESDSKAKPLVGSVEKILDYLGLSEDSEEGESVKAQLERIFATLGDGVSRDNTVSDNIARIDSVIGEGFSAESTVADQLAAEVARATEAETVLTDALGTFEDGSGFNTLVSTTAGGEETRTETVANHIAKIEEYVGITNSEGKKSLQEQIDDIETKLGDWEGEEEGTTLAEYVDSIDERIENEIGEWEGKEEGATLTDYVDKNRDEVEKELGFEGELGGEEQPKTVKEYVDDQVANAASEVTDYVDSVLGKVEDEPFFTPENTVKDRINDVEAFGKKNYLLDVEVGKLSEREAGHLFVTFKRDDLAATEDGRGDVKEIDLDLTELTKDSFLKGSYKLQIEKYSDYKKIVEEAEATADENVVVDGNILVAFDPDTFVIYSAQDNSLNEVEGKLAWPGSNYSVSEVYLVFEFTRETTDVSNEAVKQTIWLNVSDLVKSYNFDAEVKDGWKAEDTEGKFANYNVDDYFELEENKKDITLPDEDGSHKTRREVVYTLTVKKKFAEKMRKIDKTVEELRDVEEWLGYNGEEGDSILSRLDEAESEIKGLQELEFNTAYPVEPKAEDKAAIAVKTYVDNSVADEASKREALEEFVGYPNEDFEKNGTVVEQVNKDHEDIKALNDYTGINSTYFAAGEGEKSVELPHAGETISSNGRTVETIVDSITCVDEEFHKFVDEEFHGFVEGEYTDFKNLVGDIKTLEHFGKVEGDGSEHDAAEGAKTLVDVVDWNTKEIHELQSNLGKSDDNITELQEKVEDLQDQIGDGFDKNNSISKKIGEIDGRINNIVEEYNAAVIEPKGDWVGPYDMDAITVEGAFNYYFGEMSKGDLSIEDLLKA